MGDLSDKQERFCQEYVKDFNASQAAIRAGYSEKGSTVQGTRLLANVSVRARVASLKALVEREAIVSAVDVLKELKRLATVDLGGAFDQNGKLLPVHMMPEDVRRALAGIDVFDEFEGTGRDREKIGETTKIKIHDKTRALELLGKYLKMFTDKVELDVSDSLASILKAARERSKSQPELIEE